MRNVDPSSCWLCGCTYESEFPDDRLCECSLNSIHIAMATYARCVEPTEPIDVWVDGYRAGMYRQRHLDRERVTD